MKFYITTAIDYVNSKPHLGHAYEKIIADVIVRWKRLSGEETYFLTGTDENAQKVDKAARKSGKSTQEFVDDVSKNFLDLCTLLNSSHDDFIRTTEQRHVKAAQKFFQELVDKGDIYKGTYKGLYCTGCETFYLEKDLTDGHCPIHKTKADVLEEESYFFKLSKYQKQLIELFDNNKQFVQPQSKYNEIRNRLKEPLRDLSVSRFNVEWGIPVPGDNNHKIYVWFEALMNYITALDYPDGDLYKKYWPADIHLIGVDISWFHSVIWPAMLFAHGLEPPKSVFVHGFITIDGEKMSKSRGAVIDPVELAKTYGTDQLRYFLIREIPLGEDGDFSEDALIRRINGELVSDLGNLVNRVLTIAEKFDGEIKGTKELEKQLDLKKITSLYNTLELHHAVDAIFAYIHSANKYISDTEPWKQEGDALGNTLYNLIEAIRIIAIVISPVLPETAERISDYIGVPLGSIDDCVFKPFTGTITKGPHLFEKI